MKRIGRPVMAGMVCALCVAALATLIQTSVTINGRPVKAIEKDGEIYVALSGLKAAGADVHQNGPKVFVRFQPIPGAVQVDAAEGTLGEFVSNGILRIKVSNPRREGAFFQLDVEMRNAAATAFTPALLGFGRHPTLYSDNEGQIDSLPRSDRAWGEMAHQNLSPGAAVKRTLEWSARPNVDPAKFMLTCEMNETRKTLMERMKLAFLTSGPNIRIFLK